MNLEILDVAIDLSSLLADKMRVCKRVSKVEPLLEYEDSVDVVSLEVDSLYILWVIYISYYQVLIIRCYNIIMIFF